GVFDDLNGIGKYFLYYSTSGTPSGCSGASLPLPTNTANSFTHANLSAGKTYYYRVCATDRAGNTSSITGSRKAAPELDPPTGSILINAGAVYTNNTTVNLSLSAIDASGVARMCISNTDTCSGWTTYATGKSWTLPTGDGKKTVTVQYMDKYDNVSAPISAAIALDKTKPTGSVVINNGDESTTNQNVTLELSAVDNISSEDSISMRFSNNNSIWSAWEAYAASKSWYLTSGKGNKTVYVQFRDGVGNVSSVYTDTITFSP
ncbi:MAG TPA: hypothetical protein VMC44_01095, partial [Geobacteraceae bacterium]|nr:hypothetical protein [Geobacteraceae bacterium]